MSDPRVDPFLQQYNDSELRIASEFLSNWLPFLSRDICRHCTHILSNRIHSLSPEPNERVESSDSGKRSAILASIYDNKVVDDCDSHSLGSWKDEAESTSYDTWKQAENGWSDSPNINPLHWAADCDSHSLGSWKDEAESTSYDTWKEAENGWSDSPNINLLHWAADCDAHSLGSWKDEAESTSYDTWKEAENGWSDSPNINPSDTSSKEADKPIHMSWADMAQEDDELEAEGEIEENQQVAHNSLHNGESVGVVKKKTELSSYQREYLRFINIRRKKDYICIERVNGKFTNILQGLELHTGVFSAAEQKRIVDFIYDLEEGGRMEELKEGTFSAPRKWMRGKGRVTIQFGCCYNYATDKNGNPPGILKNEEVDPLPFLFKVIIKRLIRWHVLPPTCVPDSCIVNIYDEGDCIPPHIDNHGFVRPFCTISFLSECNIVFGRDLKIEGPGDFSGAIAIPLPVGSVLVLNGNGADVAKHCVPAVPTKRISITFRKMDETKWPIYYFPDPDLKGIEPLCYEDEEPRKPFPQRNMDRPSIRGGYRSERKRAEEPRYSARDRGAMRGSRNRADMGGNRYPQRPDTAIN